MKKEQLSTLGLDLGAHSAKAVLMDFVNKEPVLKGVKQFPISKEGKIFAQAKLITELKDRLGKWGQSAINVNMAISGKDVIVRFLEMPKMSVGELKAGLQYEADRYLPYQLSDAYFDTQILLDSLEGDENKMWVVLVAVKKIILEELYKLMQEIGFAPSCVEVVPTALFNALQAFGNAEDKEKDIFLLEMGAFSSIVNIMGKGVPYLTRDVDFGGEMLTRSLMKEKNLTYEKAQEEKTSPNVKWEGEWLKQIQPLVKAIKTSSMYFEGKADRAVEKILISGGMAKMSGLTDMLSTELNIPANIFSPAAQIKKELPEEESKQFEMNDSVFTCALGLAYRGVEM